MSFTLERQVEFNHCDAAGIVFYPRYFELISATVERFFDDGLGYAFHETLAAKGVSAPLVDIHVSFKAPSRLGDVLSFQLAVKALGKASANLTINCRSGDEERFVADLKIVHAQMDPPNAQPWPKDVAERFATYFE